MNDYNSPGMRILLSTLSTIVAIFITPVYVPFFGLILGFAAKWAMPVNWISFLGLNAQQLPLVFAAATLLFYAIYVGLTIYKTKNWQDNDFDEFKG